MKPVIADCVCPQTESTATILILKPIAYLKWHQPFCQRGPIVADCVCPSDWVNSNCTCPPVWDSIAEVSFLRYDSSKSVCTSNFELMVLIVWPIAHVSRSIYVDPPPYASPFLKLPGPLSSTNSFACASPLSNRCASLSASALADLVFLLAHHWFRVESGSTPLLLRTTVFVYWEWWGTLVRVEVSAHNHFFVFSYSFHVDIAWHVPSSMPKSMFVHKIGS